MKNYSACLIFLCLLCTGSVSAEMVLFGPGIDAYKETTEGYDSFVTEVYTWNEDLEQYEIDYVDPAGFNLYVRVGCAAVGQGKLSVYAYGDLYKYSSFNHPPNEMPKFEKSLIPGRKSAVKVGFWIGPIPSPIMGDGYKFVETSAKGSMVTYNSGAFLLKGRGKVDDHVGGTSISIGVGQLSGGGGTAPTYSTGDWVYDNHYFKVSVLEVRPKRPTDSGSQDDDNGMGLRPVEGYIELADGSYSSNTGTNHMAMITTSGNHYYVKWFVRSPGQTGDGTLIETDYAYGTSNEAFLSYIFPDGGGGNYTIIAKVFPWDSNASDYEESYDIAVY